MVHERTEAYAGVDVSKDRLERFAGGAAGRQAKARTPSVSPTTPPAHKRS
jgi:hypothetical protein